MYFNHFSNVGPTPTPRALRTLLLFILIFSLGSTLVESLLPGDSFWQPSRLFALSLEGVEQGLLFQLLTYPFLILPEFYFNLSYLFHLGFSLYVLWLFGKDMIERVQGKGFLLFMIFSSLFTGVVSLGAMYAFSLPLPLMGTTPLLYSLLMCWLVLFGNVQLLFFFIFPISAIHVILGVLGINLFIDLLHQQYLLAISYGSGALFGYLFPLLVWKQQSPFRFLQKLERLLLTFSFKQKPRHYQASKIYDIKTGEPVLDDEQFLEAMLSKISLYGESGLSPKEKKKLEEISKKNRRS